MLVIAFGLAFLTKRSAILFLVMPMLALLILQTRKYAVRRVKWVVGIMGGFVAVIAPVLLIAQTVSEQFSAQTVFSTGHWLQIWGSNVTLFADWMYHYFLPVAILLLLSSLIRYLTKPSRQSAFLIITALVPILVFIVISVRWYPRYLLPAVFPLVILMASEIVTVGRWLARHITGARPVLGVLVAIMVIPMGVFDVKLLLNPLTASLPHTDRWQYISGWPAGYGLSDAAKYLNSRANAEAKIRVWRNSRSIPPRHGLPHYLPEGDNLDYKTFNTADRAWAEIEDQLDQSAAQYQTWLVLNLPYEKGVPDLAEISRLRLAHLFQKPDGESQIGVYQWLTPFEFLLENGNLTPDATIGVFNGSLNILGNTSTGRLNLISLDSKQQAWSELQESISGLKYVVLDESTIRNDVLLWQPYFRIDPDTILLETLPPNWTLDFQYQSLYLFKIWEEPLLSPLAIIGHDIRLVDAQVGHTLIKADRLVLPITLYWQTDQQLLDLDTAVFVQAIDSGGQLVAQKDKTWLDGQFPATQPHPIDILSQQFELDLSESQSEFCLYIGLYSRSSGERIVAERQGEYVQNNAILVSCVE